MTVNTDFWHGKKVFLTGHTGFKGSWLSLWLQMMGAKVYGFALAPATTPNLFSEAQVAANMVSVLGDVRDYQAVLEAMQAAQPEIVIHMAAQPLVRLSYSDPVTTYSTNVMGTIHVLEAARQLAGIKAIINVTTDKCYENKEWLWGYRESEPMGGHDPYSSSKACAELATSAYRLSYFQQTATALASARAGNVIGGGDWSSDRLIPDILQAFENDRPVIIRNPHATRPWQHVLEPLAGYLTLAQHLYDGGQSYAEGWNFGPDDAGAQPVQWIVEKMVQEWGKKACWEHDLDHHPHEANYLKLDIAKAKAKLDWRPRWHLTQALQNIVEWHDKWLHGASAHELCQQQIIQYIEALKE